MKLKHNISFVGGDTVQAGDKLTPEQVKALKASGTKYTEVKEVKAKKAKTTKDGE